MVLETSWTRLKDVLGASWDILGTSWKSLGNVLEMSMRCLGDVLKMPGHRSRNRHGLDYQVDGPLYSKGKMTFPESQDQIAQNQDGHCWKDHSTQNHNGHVSNM